jgi:hypothetical protein
VKRVKCRKLQDKDTSAIVWYDICDIPVLILSTERDPETDVKKTKKKSRENTVHDQQP